MELLVGMADHSCISELPRRRYMSVRDLLCVFVP